MKRTYSSKRIATIDPKEIIATSNKAAIFDALSIKNIKEYKKEFSVVFHPMSINDPSCKKLKKKKYVKRLKLNSINKSKTTLLTPDKSLRVNKPKDPFDMLMNKSEKSCREDLKDPFDMLCKSTKCSSTSSDASRITHQNRTNDSSYFRNYKLKVETKACKTHENSSIVNLIKNVSDIRKMVHDISENSENKTIERNDTPDKNSCLLTSTPFIKKKNKISLNNISPINFKSNSNDHTSSSGTNETKQISRTTPIKIDDISKPTLTLKNTKIDLSGDIFNEDSLTGDDQSSDSSPFTKPDLTSPKVLIERLNLDNLKCVDNDKIHIDKSKNTDNAESIESGKPISDKLSDNSEEISEVSDSSDISEASITVNVSDNSTREISSECEEKEEDPSITDVEKIQSDMNKKQPVVIIERMNFETAKHITDHTLEEIEKPKSKPKEPIVILEKIDVDKTLKDILKISDQSNNISSYEPIVVLEKLNLSDLKPSKENSSNCASNKDICDENNSENQLQVEPIDTNSISLQYDTSSDSVILNDIPTTNLDKFITRRNRKIIHEASLEELDDKFDDSFEFAKPGSFPRKSVVLLPGKKWGRSLSIYKRLSVMPDIVDLDDSFENDNSPVKHGNKYRESIINIIDLQKDRGSFERKNTILNKPSLSRRSTLRIIYDSNSCHRNSLLPGRASSKTSGFLPDTWDDTIAELSRLSIGDVDKQLSNDSIDDRIEEEQITPKDIVLRRCNQTDVLSFSECFSDSALKNCRKIGEGVFGEVFMYRGPDFKARVVKVVPVGGQTPVNGEAQRTWHEIVAEVVIANELSALRDGLETYVNDIGTGFDDIARESRNSTDTFNEVLKIHCVRGSYPERLLELWDLFNESRGSENDRPDNLPHDQEYIVLELANAGEDLESYQFNNAEQALGVFLQVAYGLAVAEEALQFEHRDLHWGNVLVASTDEQYIRYVLRGRVHTVPSRGVRATLIDYSLSRVTIAAASEATLFYDLEADPALFEADGDYQFTVYRLMRDRVGKNWSKFEPYNNLLWLHYMLDKMITALRYKRVNTKIHKQYISTLKDLKGVILNYQSCMDFVLNYNFI